MNTAFHFRPILADGIDLPLFLLFGFAVVAPIMLFQVGVEGWVLARCWKQRFRDLTRFVFWANIWSLLSGIPVKFFNAWLYHLLLPLNNLATYFERYPFAVLLGTAVYFAVTVLVEGAYAWKKVGKDAQGLSRAAVWRAVLIANVATYAVLAPIHYFATQPTHDVRTFTHDSKWAEQPSVKIIYINATNGHLEAIQSDGSQRETLVPRVVKDYLVSSNLNVCLFRGEDGNLHRYVRDRATCDLAFKTTDHFIMNDIAFSPSGERFALRHGSPAKLSLMDIGSSKGDFVSIPSHDSGGKVIWSDQEDVVYVGTLKVTWSAGAQPSAETASRSEVNGHPHVCFGRVGDGHWSSGDDWGASYSQDQIGDLTAWIEQGLGSHLRISRLKETVIRFRLNPGVMHFSQLALEHPRLLHEGRECLFEGSDTLYLLNLAERKVGKVMDGHTYILLSPAYAKSLD